MFEKGTIKQLTDYIKPYKLLFFLSLLLAFITVVLTLYAPVLIGNGIDVIIAEKTVDFIVLKPILIRLLFIVLGTVLTQWFMNLCNNKITYSIVKDIRIKAFAHLEILPLKYIDSKTHGEIMSRLISDIDRISDGLLMGFNQLFIGIVTILGTLVFMLLIDIKISLIVVLLTPLSLFVAGFIAKRTYQMFRLESETRGEMTSLVEEMVGNQKLVQAFGYEEHAKKRFSRINQILGGYSHNAIFYSSLTNPCTRFVNGLVYAGVGILGAIFAIQGMISIGQLVSFLSYANQYTKPFNEISGVVTELQNAFACAARVFEFMAEKEETSDTETAHQLTEEEIEKNGSISIEHMAFSYVEEKELIKNFNLSVEKGQRVAIIGPTGCGKTTLINLLMRFYDVDKGSININGINIQNMTRNSVRKNYGMVLQETWLSSGSIKENIAYGKPDATDEEIIAAAKAVHAHGFIKRMPSGYDTVLGEDAMNLSGGQKQLLCIARVMLSIPPMLILDEATSSIDTRTEIQIQKAFAKMMKGRTSFIVAHRLSTIKEADMILVMKDGNIIEKGKHEELILKEGFYKELYNQ